MPNQLVETFETKLNTFTDHGRRYKDDDGCLTRSSFITHSSASFGISWAGAPRSRSISAVGNRSGFSVKGAYRLAKTFSRKFWCQTIRQRQTKLAWRDRHLPHSIHELDRRDKFCAHKMYRLQFLPSVLGFGTLNKNWQYREPTNNHHIMPFTEYRELASSHH